MHSRISSSTADTVRGFLKPLVASGIVHRTEAQAVGRLLSDATKERKETGKTQEPPRFLTLAEAANRLGCCKKMVRKMADEGRLTRHYLRPGSAKSLRILSSEVDQILSGDNHHE